MKIAEILTYCDQTAVWAMRRADQVPVIATVTNIVAIALKFIQMVGEFFGLKLNGELAGYLRTHTYYDFLSKMNPIRSYSPNLSVDPNLIVEPEVELIELNIDEIIEKRPHSEEEDLSKEQCLEQQNYVYENLFKPLLKRGDQDGIIDAFVKCRIANPWMMFTAHIDENDRGTTVFESKIYQKISEKYQEDDEFFRKAMFASVMDHSSSKIFISCHLKNGTKTAERIKKILLTTCKMYQYQQCSFLRLFIASLNDKETFYFISILSDLHYEWIHDKKNPLVVDFNERSEFARQIQNNDSPTMYFGGEETDYEKDIIDETQNKKNLLTIFHIVQTTSYHEGCKYKDGLYNLLKVYSKFKTNVVDRILPLFHFYQKLQKKKDRIPQKVYTSVEKKTDGKVILLPKSILELIASFLVIKQETKN